MSKRINVTSCDEVCRVAVSVRHKIARADESSQEEPEVSVVVDNVDKSRTRLRGMKILVSRLGTFVTVAVLVVAVVLVGMRIAGLRSFTVMSGSMEPNYPVGSLLYVRSVDYHDLKEGDVISYVIDDEKTVVTHRIVGIEVDSEDSSVWRFKMKGDANNLADAKLVHYKNVLGVPVVVIPFMGYFAHNIQQPPGIYIVLVVGTFLLAWTFLPGTLEERRRTTGKSVA